jgi:hypothetical protein
VSSFEEPRVGWKEAAADYATALLTGPFFLAGSGNTAINLLSTTTDYKALLGNLGVFANPRAGVPRSRLRSPPTAR